MEGSTYSELCAIYKVSNCGTIASWIKKYIEEGYNGFTGKLCRPCKYIKKYDPKVELIDSSLTASKQELFKENKRLKKENEYLKVNIAYKKN